MSLEENKAIVRRFVEVYNKQDLDLSDDLVSPDYVDPDYPQMQSREDLKQMMNMFFKAFPDFHEAIEDIIAEGGKVWVFPTYTGTHVGEWLGLAPTGKKITCKAIDMYRIVNCKIVWGRRIPTPDFAFSQTTEHCRIHRNRKVTLSRRCQVTARRGIEE